jgi:transcriptional regulator with XRE-family HTH domain
MDCASKLENKVQGKNSGTETLLGRRLARGYSLDDLAIATGLTAEEISSAEGGNAPDHHVERIEHALR